MRFVLSCVDEKCDSYGVSRELLTDGEIPAADDERRICLGCGGTLAVSQPEPQVQSRSADA